MNTPSGASRPLISKPRYRWQHQLSKVLDNRFYGDRSFGKAVIARSSMSNILDKFPIAGTQEDIPVYMVTHITEQVGYAITQIHVDTSEDMETS